MKLIIEIDEARFKDIQRIAEVQIEMSHFQTAEQIIAKGVPLEQEPCTDAISRQALINKAISWDKHFADSERYVSLTDIQNAPSVKQEPKTGHWITTRTFMHDGEYYCDKCKCDSPNNEKWDFCPNCGVKME